MSNLTDEIEALRVGLLEKHKKELYYIECLAEQQAAHHGELVNALEAVLSAHGAGQAKLDKLVGSLSTRLGSAATQTSLKGSNLFELEQVLNHQDRFTGSVRAN